MAPKTALITGCSSGFGLLAAIELARAGFRVFATMRNLGRSGALEAALASAGVTAELMQLDVTDSESMDRAVAEAGPVDVLVNNAGYGLLGFAEDVSLEELREQFETNFFGLVALTKAFLPSMRERGSGRIIQVSSLNGCLGIPALSAYCSSKFAVEGWSEALRHELLPYGVYVVLVEPGTFKTEVFNSRRRAAALDDGTSPHVALTKKLEAIGVDRANKSKADPRTVAKVIARAATERRPPLRYPVGIDAKVGTAARSMLPHRVFEFATGLLLRN